MWVCYGVVQGRCGLGGLVSLWVESGNKVNGKISEKKVGGN